MRKERGKREGVERGKWSKGGTERERESRRETERKHPVFPGSMEKDKNEDFFFSEALEQRTTECSYRWCQLVPLTRCKD